MYQQCVMYTTFLQYTSSRHFLSVNFSLRTYFIKALLIQNPLRAIRFTVKYILRFQNRSFVSGIETYFSELKLPLENRSFASIIEASMPEKKPGF